ncbi:MAG: YfhO family protein [Eubacteriales bacterium]|nr:YfhO family protein [Eubacteriales bacterium]
MVKRKRDTMVLEYHLVWCFLLSFMAYYVVSMVTMKKFLHYEITKALIKTVTFEELTVYVGFILIPATLFLLATVVVSVMNWKKMKQKKGMIGRKGLVRSVDGSLTKIAEKHPYVVFFFLYTILFAITAFLFFSALIGSKKSLIWTIDGMPQYVPYLKYTGEYLREGIRTIARGDISLKMFDFNIGMGEDITTALRTHFTELVSVFIPSAKTAEFYDYLMIGRFYLAGLSFAVFCRYHKKPWMSTMIGSLIYVFSGFTLNFGVRHPIFSAPIIYLPLLLVAIDRLIKDGKCLLYALLVGMSLFSNYYFLYINTFAMGIYALIRFFSIHKKERIREFFLMMIRIISSYILGCAMASVVFLPTLIRTLSSERVGSGSSRILTESLWNYGDKRLIRIFISSIAGKYTAGYTSYFACAAIVLPAVAALLLGSVRKKLGVKIAFVLEVIFLSVPVFGFIFAGFSNTNNRWAYAVVFTMAYITVEMVEDLRKLHFLQILAVIAVASLYYFIYKMHFANNQDIRMSMIILAVTVGLLLFANIAKNMSRLQYSILLMFCVILSLFVHGRYMFDGGKSPFKTAFMDRNVFDSKFSQSRYHNFAEIEDEDFYRCDTYLTWDYYENTPLLLKYNGTSMYNSILNSAVINYHRELDSIGISAVHRYYGLDGRTTLENLANVKYYMTEKGNDGIVPYGFKKASGLGDDNYDIYQNKNMLPIGYTYDSYMPKSEYEELSSLEKQEMQIRSVVIDTEKQEEFVDGLTAYAGEKPAQIESEKISEFTCEDGVEFEDGKIHVEDNETGFTFNIPRKAGYEAYLAFHNLETNKTRAVVRVDCGGYRKKLVARSDNEVYSLKRSDFLVYLGYSEEDGEDNIRVSFETHGDYGLENVEVQYLSMDDYEEVLADRQEEALENVVIGKNEVKGDVSITGNKVMAFSIPYSKGWKAYVDGKETDLIKVNTMYMGIRLGEGDHTVRLSYVTPGFILGLAVTGVSVLIFLLLCFFHMLRMRTIRKRKKQRKMKAKQKTKNRSLKK